MILRLVLLALLYLNGSRLAAQDLELRFLNVGQGDAALIRHDGRTALIDAGRSDDIVTKLRALGVDTINLLIASHNHADHIGGADAVLRSFPVLNYMDNGLPHTTQTYRRTIELVRDLGVTYLQPTARTISMGDARLRILAPPRASDQNNTSVGVVVERGEFKALLPGDSELQEIAFFLAAGVIPDVDLLKAAHHGSHNGVTTEWLEQSNPEVVVISVGRNSYGHPHQSALRLYRSSSREVLRTDEVGDIIVSVDSAGCYEITTDRAQKPSIEVREPTNERPAAAPARQPAVRPCCRVCRRGKACGNSCIARNLTCHQPPGCACNG